MGTSATLWPGAAFSRIGFGLAGALVAPSFIRMSAESTFSNGLPKGVCRLLGSPPRRPAPRRPRSSAPAPPARQAHFHEVDRALHLALASRVVELRFPASLPRRHSKGAPGP